MDNVYKIKTIISTETIKSKHVANIETLNLKTPIYKNLYPHASILIRKQ